MTYNNLPTYYGFTVSRSWPGGYWQAYVGDRHPSGRAYIIADTRDGLREMLREIVAAERKANRNTK